MREAPEEISELSIGAYNLHHIEQDHLEMRRFSSVAMLRDESETWTLPRGTMITGTIFGPDGKPIPKADIAYGGDQVPSNTIPYWYADENGHYSVAVKPGVFAVITASPHGYAPDLKTLTVGTEPTVIDFHLDKARTISGMVVDAQGAPVPHASVYFDTWRGFRSNVHPDSTDSRGQFSWPNAPADPVLVDVFAKGLTRKSAVPMTAGEPITVKLDPLAKITVRVSDAQSNQPVPAFRCISGSKFGDNERITWFRGNSALRGSNGQLTFSPELPYANNAVLIEADGYAPAASRLFTEAEHDVTLDIQLTPAPALSALVENPDGTPAAGATAALVPAGENLFIDGNFGMSDYETQKLTLPTDGRITFPPVAGSFKIVVIGDGGYGEISEEQIRAGTTTHLQKWAQVAGVLQTTGARNTAQKIKIDSPPTTHPANDQPHITYQITAITDAQGKFAFNRVPPGHHTIGRYIERGSGQNYIGMFGAYQTVDLKPGEVNPVSLGGNGREIIGRANVPVILKSRGGWVWSDFCTVRTESPELVVPADIQRASVEAQRAWFAAFQKSEAGIAYNDAVQREKTNARSYPLEIDPDGQFHVEDVAAGTYTLSVSAGDASPIRTGNPGSLFAEGRTRFTVPPIIAGQTADPIRLPPITLEIRDTRPNETTRPSSRP